MCEEPSVVSAIGSHLKLGQANIYERRWARKDGQFQQRYAALVYLCHGYAEHCGYFNQLAECLAAAGILVVGQDFYGHGLSDGSVNQVWSFDTFVEHAATHLALLRVEFPDLTIHGVGYSMGALVLHRLCSRGQRLLNGGMVWLSPALQPVGLRLTKRRVELGRRLLQYLPNLPVPGGRFHPADLTRSRETAQMSKDASIKQRTLYTRFCSAMLEAMQLTMPDTICLPTLVVLGTADKIADAVRSGSFVAAAQALGKPVTSRVYPGGMHHLHTDLPAVGVPLHQELLAWLQQLTP